MKSNITKVTKDLNKTFNETYSKLSQENKIIINKIVEEFVKMRKKEETSISKTEENKIKDKTKKLILEGMITILHNHGIKNKEIYKKIQENYSETYGNKNQNESYETFRSMIKRLSSNSIMYEPLKKTYKKTMLELNNTSEDIEKIEKEEINKKISNCLLMKHYAYKNTGYIFKTVYQNYKTLSIKEQECINKLMLLLTIKDICPEALTKNQPIALDAL